MVSADSTFLIDVLHGHPPAVSRLKELLESSEPTYVTPPAAAEVLVGAHAGGGKQRSAAEGLLGTLLWLDFDLEACREAGRIGADLLGRGEPLSAPDLMIAAISLRHRQPLITRDQAFSRVRGLRVETY